MYRTGVHTNRQTGVTERIVRVGLAQARPKYIVHVGSMATNVANTCML